MRIDDVCAGLCACVGGRRSIQLGGHVPEMRRQTPVADQYRTGQGGAQGPRKPDTEWLRHNRRASVQAHQQRTHRYIATFPLTYRASMAQQHRNGILQTA